MGKRGPAPTPSKVLQLRGTFRKDRHGDASAEPAFAPLTVLPPAPGFLDDTGRYEWERVGPELIAKGLLTEMDLAAFTAYCVSVSRMRTAEAEVARVGLTVLSPQGLKANPAVQISRQAGAEIRKFCQEFGLTPSARTRVRGVDTKPKRREADPWEGVG